MTFADLGILLWATIPITYLVFCGIAKFESDNFPITSGPLPKWAKPGVFVLQLLKYGLLLAGGGVAVSAMVAAVLEVL